MSAKQQFHFFLALIPSGYLDSISDYLYQNGMLGTEVVSEEEGIHLIKVYFDSFEKLERCKGNVISSVEHMVILNTNTTDEEEWIDHLHGKLEPVHLKRLSIVHSTGENFEQASDKTVFINPGRGFGTGTHATTKLALELMEEYVLRGSVVIDVGTGSGILAVAAIRLGADRVYAVEPEADALENARENAEQNGCSDRIDFHEGSIEAISGQKADVVVVNIIAPVIRLLLEDGLADLVKNRGSLIVSGVLGSEAPSLIEAVVRKGFKLLEKRDIEEWCGFLFCSN